MCFFIIKDVGIDISGAQHLRPKFETTLDRPQTNYLEGDLSNVDYSTQSYHLQRNDHRYVFVSLTPSRFGMLSMPTNHPRQNRLPNG